MKYLFVNTHYFPDTQYGGVVQSGGKLFKYLMRLADFTISAVSRHPKAVTTAMDGKGRCYPSIFLHSYGFSFSAIFGLFTDVRLCNAAIINGIVAFPVTLAALYCVLLGKPFIVASRGGLEPWRVAHKKWKKYFYYRFITLPLMRRASHIHVTSDEEERNIRNLDFQNIIKITNGVDLEDFADLPVKTKAAGGRFVFLFLSRTDKEKGLDILIEAYKKLLLEVPRNKVTLVICGPDHQRYLKGFALDYEKENITYTPGVYGADKIKALRNADVLVLPSYSENFGNVVAEALACETPVITTTGTPWAEIESVGCGLYIAPEAEALYQAMKAMYLKPEAERRAMGQRGREYVLKNFNWEDKARELFGYLQKLAPVAK